MTSRKAGASSTTPGRTGGLTEALRTWFEPSHLGEARPLRTRGRTA